MEQTKIEKLYDNPKAKGFVNHLIQSYLPIYKVNKVWEFEKDQKPVCNVCSQKLMDAHNIFQGFSDNVDEFKKDLLIDLKKMVNNEPRRVEDHPMAKMAKGRVLAFTGEKTNTCLCHKCVQELLEMTQNRLLMGDNNISYQLKQMQRNQVFGQFTNSTILDDEEKQKVQEIKKQVDKKKTATLGDLNVLQQLKAKMEVDENKS